MNKENLHYKISKSLIQLNFISGQNFRGLLGGVKRSQLMASFTLKKQIGSYQRSSE